MVDIIPVDENDYMRITSADTLTSGGLGPCIAVGAVYDRSIGYLAHVVPAVGGYKEKVDRLLKDLESDVFDKRRLKIYVVGGGLIDLETKVETLDNRREVLQLIANKGFSKSIKKVKWCPVFYGQVLTVTPRNGRIEIEEFNASDI